MAKLNGPLGSKLRGKVGEVVAAKTVGGDTAIRAYQPVVKNPRTARQQASRARLSAVSYVGSMLAAALNIGFAKAVQGKAMYPRNLFVSDMVKSRAGITISGGEITDIAWTDIPVSKKAGIGVAPSVTITPSGQGTVAKATITNSALVEVNTAVEKLGVVLVIPMELGGTFAGEAMVIQSTEMSNIELPATAVGFPLMAFFKKVPLSGNEVDTDTTPWKYPSDTSATAYVGTIA